MAVKEQNRFSIGRIGVTNADRSGEILNRSIANNAAQIVKTIEPLAFSDIAESLEFNLVVNACNLFGLFNVCVLASEAAIFISFNISS